MIKAFITATSLGAVVLFAAPDTSEAATIGIAPTGVTSVTVTANLGGLGLSGVPAGSAINLGATFFFPNTGGTIDTTTNNALIEHEGSGVTLFALARA